MTEIKICPQCYRLYKEKEECSKWNIELKSLEEFAQSLGKCLEYRRGLHIDYIDQSLLKNIRKRE